MLVEVDGGSGKRLDQQIRMVAVDVDECLVWLMMMMMMVVVVVVADADGGL